MRVTKEVMAVNNAKIVDEAVRLFMEKGIEMTSVTEVMSAAGLTHGGFYRHFDSKDDLVSVAITKAVGNTIDRIKNDVSEYGPEKAVTEFINRYLSEQHINNPGMGCPIAALGAEIDRKSLAHSDAISQGSEKLISLLAAGIDGDSEDAQAIARGLLALLVGTVVLARSFNSKSKKVQLLSSSYDLISVTLLKMKL